MSNNTMFKQCVLNKQGPDGFKSTVTWLPAEFAVKGRTLRLKKSDDSWDLGWTVFSVSETALSEKCLPDYHKDIKAHRKATGDSMPKKG